MHLKFTAQLESLELALPDAVDIDVDSRTITGLIVPFGQTAPRTSYGKPIQFAAGCLVVPQDPSRVKLLVDHDHGRPVGYALDIRQDPDGAVAQFRISSGPVGDQALTEAREKLRDGLSVGVDIVAGDEQSGAYVVTEAFINEVSLCAIPAFADARVTSVAASKNPQAAEPGDQEDDDETDVDDTQEEPMEEEENTEQTSAAFNHAPAFHTSNAGSVVTLSQAFDAIAQAIQTSANAAQVQAALTDILPAADAGKGLLTETHVGELWQARGAETPYVDFAFTRKQLTSGLKMIGWAWNARPTVAPYAGNKEEIPSSTATTKPIEATVARMAGGWDVDRIYVDLADGAMLNELVRMALEDYADKINANGRTALLAAAQTLTTADMDLSGVLQAVGAAASGIGARIDYLAMAPDVWTAFASMTALDVPWWLRTNEGINIGTSTGTIGNVKLWVDPQLGANAWVAGDKRAASWWDKQPPVRVQAIDLPRGGVDVGVFGYYARVVSEPKAVWKGTTTPAAGGGE